jgi:hypothetical protein
MLFLQMTWEPEMEPLEMSVLGGSKQWSHKELLILLMGSFMTPAFAEARSGSQRIYKEPSTSLTRQIEKSQGNLKAS